MNKQMIKYIRWIFSGLLAFGVYKETGIFTALSCFLIFTTFEILVVWIAETTEILAKLVEQIGGRR